MGKLFRLLLIVIIIASCSKNNGGSGSSSADLLPDTLTTGWTKLSSLPGGNFKDIFFTDNSTGFAVSNNGIYKSTNGGDEWTLINPTSSIANIGAANSNNACFPDGSYSIFATQDAGSSFSNTAYVYPGGGTVGFYDCFFSSPSTVFFSSNQFVWSSTNGGATADTVFQFSNASATSSLFFLNDTKGWLVREDGVYETADGGDSWMIDTTLDNGYGSIEFLDPNIGYFSNYGTINKTTDGGHTWLPVFETGNQAFADIDFISVDEGYFGQGKKIYKTTDAGNTWTTVVTLGNQFISGIHFTDANHGWACTSDGTLVRFAQ